MTKAEANKQLNIGYFIFISGFILGLIFNTKDKGMPPLGLGYIIWGTYWGYRSLYKNIKLKLKKQAKDKPVVITSPDVFNYFHKIHQYKFVTELIIFFICYILGNMGIGIYKQIILSKIAYF